jgi:glutamate synthase (NADPH) large chain
MAEMGFRTVEEMVGRVDRIDMNRATRHWKAHGVDLSRLLHRVEPVAGHTLFHSQSQDHALDGALDVELITACRNAIDKGEPVQLARPIRNVNRTVGAMLSGEVARRHGHQGLAPETIRIEFTGVAGQSFGAWLAHGITLRLTGDANDYVGKGLSGGRIVVRPPAGVDRDPGSNIIVGNTVLYGAIAGEAYLGGVAGERFAVRNSGAIAVVEGCGDHGCEYMTGGAVVVLGKTGRNFAAGMSGGVAYVYDPHGTFARLCNTAQVDLAPVSAARDEEDGTGRPLQRPRSVDDLGLGDMLRHDAERLRILIERHKLHTDSAKAAAILDDWENAVGRFVKVMPTDYARALKQLEAEREEAATVAAE